jgi:hypothetical protein
VASTGVATGTVIALGTAPVVTGLCAAAVFRERLTRWWVAATGLAVFGCEVLVTADSQGTAQVSPTGVALAAAAGTGYGVYTTAANALLNQGVPATAAMAVTLSLGAVLLALVIARRRVGSQTQMAACSYGCPAVCLVSGPTPGEGSACGPGQRDLNASRSSVIGNPSHNAAVTTESTAAAELVSKSSTRGLLRLYGAIVSKLVSRPGHTVT